MARLEILDLSRNQIGDAGLEALADACAGGALASLKALDMDYSNRQHPALKAVCQKRGIALQ